MLDQTTKPVIHEEKTYCTKKEQLGHALGVLGHDSAYTLWAMWMTPFLTDIVMIPAKVLGVLLVAGRIFDGVNDIMMGAFADRTRTKWGRFRPWIIRAGPLFCVCMALSFVIPSENLLIRIIYASVMYIAVDVVFTAVDIPFWSLPAAMTSNTKERSSIIGTTQTVSNAISSIVGIVMPLALVYFGGVSKASSYFKIAALVAAFAIAMYVICFKTVREHIVPDPSEKFSLVLGLKSVFTNKPLLCVQIANAVALLSMIMRGNFSYFYCRYNLGGIEIMTIKSLIGTVGTIIGSLLFIFLAKHIGKKKIVIGLGSIYIAACIGLYFAGWSNLMLMYIGDFVFSACVGGFMVAVNAMMADTIEYGEWKSGQRNEGMITSTRCFVTKLVSAASGLAVAVVISTAHYVPNAEVQSLQTLNAFHIMMTLVCAGIMALGIIPMIFYKLTEEKHAEIMVELANRKAAKEAAKL